MIPALALMLLLQASPAIQKPPIYTNDQQIAIKQCILDQPLHIDFQGGTNHRTQIVYMTPDFGCLSRNSPIPELTQLLAPPDFTVTPCDITSLAGDCGYLFETITWPVIVSAHMVLDSVQAAEQSIPIPTCTEKSTSTCYDPSLPHCFMDDFGEQRCTPPPPENRLAKSMADQGWSCTYDEIHISCSKKAGK